MRTTLRHTLAACIALSALMLTGTACTDHDDLRTPAGTQLLALGEVTVAGTDVATTRSAATTGSTTRATQDDKGFTGIRKTGFVDGDVLTLTLSNVPSSSTPVTVTATMGAGNTWTLNPAKVYYAPATTTLTATTYTPAVQPGSEAAGTTGGIAYKDDLTAATPISLAADGTKLALTLTHANAMLEVTPPAGLTTYTDLTISATTPTGGSGSNTPQDLGYFTQGTANDLRLLTIAPAGSTAPTISLKVNGITYTTTLTTTMEANKRYPITLSIVGDDLVATLATPTLNWGTNTDFEGIPTGYTHYIRTAADLVAFRDAVNAAASTDTWTALQMADIDLGQISSWTPIGTNNNNFMGSYNGNGHTISNLKIDENTIVHVGLFGVINRANITGVHVRNCSIKSTGVPSARAGALAGFAIEGVITLCSATGTVEASGSYGFQIGGLIGRIYNSTTTTYVNRCSANVDVTMNATGADAYCGAFTGYAMRTHFTGCIASGKVTKAGSLGTFSGFSNAATGGEGTNLYHCITNSDLTNAGTVKTAFGTAVRFFHCLATQSGYTNFGISGGASSSVCLSSPTNIISGIAINTAPADAYATLAHATAATFEPITTLHYSQEDGYTFTPVTRTWYAADIWQDNTDALPTLDMTYEGKP